MSSLINFIEKNKNETGINEEEDDDNPLWISDDLLNIGKNLIVLNQNLNYHAYFYQIC